MLKLEAFLPIFQHQGQLSARAHWQSKKAHTLCSWSTHRASHRVGCMWVREMKCSRTHGPSGRVSKWNIPSSLWAGFLIDSTKWLIRSMSFWCLLGARLLFSQPLSAPELCSIPQYSRWGERSGPFWQHSTQLGSQVLLHTFSVPPAPDCRPVNEATELEGLPLALSCSYALGEG